MFANVPMKSLKRILVPIGLGFVIAASANATVVTVTSSLASAAITIYAGGSA